MTTNFYTDVRRYGNNILFRGINNGRSELGKVKFKPTLYAKSKNQNSEWKSLYGDPLEPKKFVDINEAKEYLEKYKDVNGFEVHGMEAYEYQFIAEKYPIDISYDIKQTKLYLIDLEVVDPSGNTPFPDVATASVPIVLISLLDYNTNKAIVFGWRDYITDSDDEFKYRNYPNELSMLSAFIDFWKQDYPHFYSGYNTESFDTPYLINRIRRVLGEDAVNSLSPFGKVSERNKKNSLGQEVQTYEIYGIVELDYLLLYRKFTFGGRESFALGFISQLELGETKLEIDSDSFYDSYTNHYQKFVKYNFIDVKLVKKLDDKMKLFDLILTMAYMVKCNITDIFGPVKTWDIFVYNHLLSKKTAVPPKKIGTSGEFEGAWVKEPVPGMYGWTISFDAASLYPTIIRQWNLSPETLVRDHRLDITVDDVVKTEQGLANYAHENNCTVAANGTFYRKDKKGIFPELMELLTVGRKSVKKKMLALEQEMNTTNNHSLESEISSLNNKQLAFKLLNNSGFGGISNPAFRYYDLRIGAAITLTGQACDRHLEKSLNVYMNNLLKTENIDYVIYGDTDSLLLSMDTLVRKLCKTPDDSKVVTPLLDKICKAMQNTVIKESIDHIFDLCNCKEKLMDYKREAIASKCIFLKKKKYLMKIHNSEGVDYDPPKLKIMGVEIVRSSTPQFVRKELKAAIPIIFDSDVDKLREFVSGVERNFKAAPVETISFPRGVNNIEKYSNNGTYIKGTPVHVRASILYNHHTEPFGKYDKIRSSDKIKFVYLKIPNPIKEDVIGFPTSGVLPPELNLHKYIDYDKMFETAFLSPLENITNAIGWTLVEKSSLDAFFG